VERAKRRSPEQIQKIAFRILKNHAFGTLRSGLKAADAIDCLIELDPTLEEEKDDKIPLVEMRKKIEKIKLTKV